jgi:hypothetical protein
MSWKLLNNSLIAIADRGAKGISYLCNGDPKAYITVIATIDTAGEKLLPCVITKGETERCKREICEDCTMQVEKNN